MILARPIHTMTALSAYASPYEVSGSSASSPVTSDASTAVGTGGSGNYTYAWAAISNPDSIVILAATSASTTFRKTFAGYDTVTGTFRCLVTDTTTGETAYTDTVTVELTYEP